MTPSISRSRSASSVTSQVTGSALGISVGERGQALGATRGQDGNAAGVADRLRELGTESGARSGDDHDMFIEPLHSVL